MIAKYAENQKNLMSALLTKDTFDIFELMSGTVTTYAQFTVDGTLRPQFFGADPDLAPLTAPGSETAAQTGVPEVPSAAADGIRCTPWKELRGHFLSVIRGKRPPLSFRFVFRLPAGKTALLLDSAGLTGAAGTVTSFIFTLSFDGAQILITTGVSYSSFSMDKRPEEAFDAYILDYFRMNALDLRDP